MSSLFRLAITLAAVLIALLAINGSTVFAQSSECSNKRQVGTNALDEFTWKRLNKIYQDVGEENYDEAYDLLQKMLTRAGKDSYLRSILNQALAQVEWSTKNYDSALEYFEKAVQLDALPNAAHFALMYQIAQLYFMQERYRDALDKLELWFCNSPRDKITSSAWVLKASIHVQQDHYTESLQAIEIAVLEAGFLVENIDTAVRVERGAHIVVLNCSIIRCEWWRNRYRRQRLTSSH